jgi:hypothetical protein
MRFLVIVVPPSSLSYREKKSLNDNDMCPAEQEIFELTVRFQQIAL